MRTIVRRVDRLEDTLAATRQEGGISLVVMPAGYSDAHPDLDREITALQDAGVLPKAGLIVLPAAGQIGSGWEGNTSKRMVQITAGESRW